MLNQERRKKEGRQTGKVHLGNLGYDKKTKSSKKRKDTERKCLPVHKSYTENQVNRTRKETVFAV